MDKKHSYDTLSQAMNSLKDRGFNDEVDVIDESHVRIGDREFSDQEIEILEFHRFEGMTNPADTSVVYALNSKDGSKGLLVDAYGVDASVKVSKFLQNVSMD